MSTRLDKAYADADRQIVVSTLPVDCEYMAERVVVIAACMCCGRMGRFDSDDIHFGDLVHADDCWMLDHVARAETEA